MFTYMLRRSQMKFIHIIRTAKQKWNSLVTRQLRKVGIFKRLNVSFLALLLISALFLTFFPFSVFQRNQSEPYPLYLYAGSEHPAENTGYHGRI